MAPEMTAAIHLISSLHEGDWVKVTADGRTYTMAVMSEPTRSDGSFGSPESTGVTVGFGRNGYATRVQADNLVRTRVGHGWVGGGTVLERVEPDPDWGPNPFCQCEHHAPNCPMGCWD
jgi:hypothetical protein